MAKLQKNYTQTAHLQNWAKMSFSLITWSKLEKCLLNMNA